MEGDNLLQYIIKIRIQLRTGEREVYGGQRLTRLSEESLVHLSVTREKVTMTSLIHESTCQKEKAVITFTKQRATFQYGSEGS